MKIFALNKTSTRMIYNIRNGRIRHLITGNEKTGRFRRYERMVHHWMRQKIIELRYSIFLMRSCIHKICSSDIEKWIWNWFISIFWISLSLLRIWSKIQRFRVFIFL